MNVYEEDLSLSSHQATDIPSEKKSTKINVFEENKLRDNRPILHRKTEILMRSNNQECFLINKVRESGMFHNLEQINWKNKVTKKLTDLEERKEEEYSIQKGYRSDFFNKIQNVTKENKNRELSQQTFFNFQKSEKINENQKKQGKFESFINKNREKTVMEHRINGRKSEMVYLNIENKKVSDALSTSTFTEKKKNFERISFVKVEEVLERLKEGGGKRRTKDVDVKLGKV